MANIIRALFIGNNFTACTLTQLVSVGGKG